jgi:hypothetical protein
MISCQFEIYTHHGTGSHAHQRACSATSINDLQRLQLTCIDIVNHATNIL